MAPQNSSEPDEAQIVGNSRPDHLYTHEWSNGAGKYLNVVIDEVSGQPQAIDINLDPNARNRIKVTITFVREHDQAHAEPRLFPERLVVISFRSELESRPLAAPSRRSRR